MTLNEALCCLTRDAAYAAHREHAIGSLEAAKWVGFIVIDQDLFAMPAADLHTLGAPHTWVAGRKV